MIGQLDILLFRMVVMSICAIHGSTGQTLQVIVVVDIRLIIVSIAASAWASGQVATTIFAVEGTLIGVDGRKIVSSVDGRSRIGDEMIAQMGEGAFHGRVLS